MLNVTDTKDIDRIKRKSVFELAQNAQIQIILRMRKVSSGSLLSIHAFCIILFFFILFFLPYQIFLQFYQGSLKPPKTQN